MQEYFSFNNLPFTFVFEPWYIGTSLALGFTCLSIGAVALLFEGIRVFRVWVKTYFHVSPLIPILSPQLAISGITQSDAAIPVNQSYIRSNRIYNHVIQTFIHGTRLALGYYLMLAIMTFNSYIAIAIIGGACLGYFLFCHELTKWHEPDVPVCQSRVNGSVATTSSTVNSTPPCEESHPMLRTCSKASTSLNSDIAIERT
ncbi:protein SLC31A2-like [Styela clava]|uniref:probable low affinity copper uptake protein 2 n=1 Tax=Styela clava TaxID=7725 RepID=UPI001939FC34|nr:probable low affinity copper uptake protein 2 [Styela clava]